MRVIVPEPARTQHVAALALEAEGVDHEVRQMADDLDYGRLLRELWEAGEEFCIVEHDIRPAPGQVAELEGCELGVLCGYDYPGPEGDALGHALGLTRFSAEVMALAPEAPLGWGDNRALWKLIQPDGTDYYNREGLGELVSPGLQWDLTEWIQVDAAIFDALAGYGISVNPTEDGHRFAHIFHVHGEVAHARTAAH